MTSLDDMTSVELHEWCSRPFKDEIAKLRAEVERLQAEIDQAQRVFHDTQWRQLTEAHAEIKRLRNTIKLHAGDCQSLNNEVTMFKERAEAAEAEIERLQASLAEWKALAVQWAKDNQP